jgi:hypothetical protein
MVYVLSSQRIPATRLPPWGFGHQMEVVAHQTIGMHFEAGLLAGFGEGLQEVLSVDVVLENVLPAVPAAHDMADGTWELRS